ncbi:Bacterial protein of unknown function (DUF924) domain containing protein [Naviculisporaceae sp. PSN 640]
MTTLAESIRATFTPSVFAKVREFWFGTVADDTQLILPPSNLIKQWFTSDAGFDETCRENFQPQLDFITTHHDQLSGNIILSALGLESPDQGRHGLQALDYLALIILLDQVPRNYLRGASAKIAFTIFDPLVLEIVKTAIAKRIPQSDEIRYRTGYQLWFFLPLQHAEDRETQALSLKEHEGIFEDLKDLVASAGNENDIEPGLPAVPNLGTLSAPQIRQLLLREENKASLEKWEKMLVSFALRHKKVIDRFGRFPHRNEVTGREFTEEEARYLAEGGETFSSSREKFEQGHAKS